MDNQFFRVMAVDPGDQRIGIAISDLTRTIANPLVVIKHVQRRQDAEKIVSLATENEVGLIVVGQSLYTNGEPNPSGRKAARLAEVIKEISEIRVILWDEHESTKIARKVHKEMGSKKKKQQSHLDDLAATIILQSYLDANQKILNH